MKMGCPFLPQRKRLRWVIDGRLHIWDDFCRKLCNVMKSSFFSAKNLSEIEKQNLFSKKACNVCGNVVLYYMYFQRFRSLAVRMDVPDYQYWIEILAGGTLDGRFYL